jgi:hypothetical protein
VAAAEQELAVLAVLRPASGRELTGEAVITAASLAEYAPDPKAAETVAGVLRSAGFGVGPLVGIAMTVTGSRERFERYFGRRLELADDGGWHTSDCATELPLDAVPHEARRHLVAVAFEPPAEAVQAW